MDATWIVSANASRARFFSQDNAAAPLQEVHDMVNEAARLDTNESETDRLGPTSAGQSMHNTGGALPNKTYEPDTTPDKRAAEIFAKDIAKYLQQGYQEGRFKQLAVVASPKFLGALRSELTGPLGAAVSVQIDEDYTQFGPEQLREQIKTHKANE